LSRADPRRACFPDTSAIRQPGSPQPDRGAIPDSGITVNPSLDISIQTVGGMTIAELAGELDIASAPALREQLLGLLRPGSSQFVIDLSKVSLCDASGLAVLGGRLAAGRPGTAYYRAPPAPSYVPAVHAAAAGLPAAHHSRTGAVAEIAARLQPFLDAPRWLIPGGG
jgi:anti-sigma B factor antagonist